MRSTPRDETVRRHIVRVAPVALECGHFPDPAFHALQEVGDRVTCIPCTMAAKKTKGDTLMDLLPENCDDCGAPLDRWNTCSAGCVHYCVACGEPCFRCPSGWVCKNSHGNGSPRVVRAALAPKESEDMIRPCPFCKSRETTTLEVSLQKGLRRMACKSCKQEWVWSDGTKASLEDAVSQAENFCCDICRLPMTGNDHAKCELQFALLGGHCVCGSRDIAGLTVNLRGRGSMQECGGCGRRWVEKDGKIVEIVRGPMPGQLTCPTSPIEGYSRVAVDRSSEPWMAQVVKPDFEVVARQEGFEYGKKAAEAGALFGSEALHKFADAMALRCCTLEKSAANTRAWADGYVEGYGGPSTLCEPKDVFNTDSDREKEDHEMTQLPTTPLGAPDPFVASVESAIVSVEERTNASTQLEAVRGYLVAYKAAVVNTPETFAWAADQAKWVKSLWNDVEARRTFFTKPLLEIKRRVDAVFMPTTKELEACERELKSKMEGFDRMQREAQRAAMQASTQVFAQGGTPTEPIPEVARAQGVTIKHAWIPRIVDESLVPRELCSPDLVKIQKAIWYANTETPPRPIPGVEFVLDSSTTVRR